MSEMLKGYAVVSAEGALISIWHNEEYAKESIDSYHRFLGRKTEQRVVVMVEAPAWRPIESIPHDDTRALVKWDHGGVDLVLLDRSTTPEFWRRIGAINWMPIPA